TILRARDFAAVVSAGEEAAFDQSAGNLDVANDDETRAFYSTIVKLRMANQRRVRGAGERHVFGVARIAGAKLQVGDARPVGHHRRHAARRERVSLDAGRSRSAAVEMDRDENGVAESIRD